jgi:hypothetical protein
MRPIVDGRVVARGGAEGRPVHVGFVAPNMKGGVILTSAPSVHYGEYDNREKQLDAWEAYLKNAEGAETKLVRIYPRDFWMP